MEFNLNKVKRLLERNEPLRVSIRLKQPQARVYTYIDDGDILQGSFNINMNATSGDKFELGYVESSELQFALLNDNGKFDNIAFEGVALHVLIYMLDGIDIVPVARYTYVVDERPIKGKVLQIRALDGMAKFDTKLDRGLITTPCTLRNLTQQLCNIVGVDLSNKVLCNDDYIVDALPKECDKMSYHQILGYIMQLQGAIATVTDESSTGMLVPIDVTTDISDALPNNTAINDMIFVENDITISGIKFNHILPNQGNEPKREITYLAGANDYALDLTGNPLLTKDFKTVIGRIANKWQGFTYRPFSKFQCSPIPYLKLFNTFKAGDKTFLITNIDYKYDGMMSMKSAGTPKVQKGYASPNGLTDSQRQIVNAIVVEKAESIEKNAVDTYKNALVNLNESVTRALGFYQTVVTKNGDVKIYTHDAPTLDESKYIETKSAAGELAWTTTGWNGGSPKWQYGYTRDGSLVMRLISTVGINAEWIRLGDGNMQKYLDDKYAEQIAQLSKLSLSLQTNTYIDGEPVARVVSKMMAGLIELKDEIIKSGTQDGSNMILNPTFGVADRFDPAHWDNTVRKNWGYAHGMIGTWLNAKKYTWQSLLDGRFGN